MAKYLPLPKSLIEADKSFIKDAIELSERNFKGDLFGEVNSPLSEPTTTFDGQYHWATNKDFLLYATDLTQTNDIRSANTALYQTLSRFPEYEAPTMTELPKGVDPNMLTPDQLKQYGEKAEIQKTKSQAAEKNAENIVKSGIKKQQAIYEAEAANEEKIEEKLKGQKIYYQIDEAPIEKPQEVKDVEEQAQAKPKQFVNDAANVFESKAEEVIGVPDQSPEAARDAAQQAALTTYETFTGNSPIIPAAIMARFVSDPKILKTVTSDAQTQRVLKDISSDLVNQKLTQFELAKRFANLAKIGGYTDLAGVNVQLSSFPRPGFKEFDINKEMVTPHRESLKMQSDFLGSLKNFGEGEIKAQVLSKSGAFLESQIAKLPAGSALAKAYDSNIVRLGISSLGLGAELEWVGTTTLGKIALSTGYGPVLGWAGQITGIDFGVGVVGGALGGTAAALAASTAATATNIAITGGVMASEAFLGGAGAAAGTAVAPGLGTILGAIGGFLAGLIGGKALQKPISKLLIWMKKHQDLIGALSVGGIVTLFGAPIVGVGLGGLTFILLSGNARNIIGGAFLFSRNFFANLILEISIFAIVGFIVFSAIVAFVLFIINSGAYVVPPSPNSLNLGGFSSPYVGLTKTADPAGPFTNSDIPKDVTYTITVKPKKGSLNNVQLSYNCQVISKTISKCPDIKIEDKYKDVFTKPIDSISTTGITITYTSTYDSRFKDAAIIDSIKLSAVSATDNNAVSTEASASVTFGTPPISCPVLGGHAATPSLNFSLNSSNNTGHGSAAYWKAMHQSPSAYPLPQSTSCYSISDCSYYGYAYDVFPTGSQEVFAPTVLGKDVTWSCSYAFANPGAGNTYHCISSDGNEMLSLTHMASGAKTGTIKSGEKIGKLFFQPGNTHLHIEFQLNGRYVKPENYFCGGK